MTPREPLVRNFMTLHPMVIDGEKSVQDARELMTRFGVRHLPVVKDGIVVGVLGEHELHSAGEAADRGRMRTADACSRNPFIVDPETPVHEAAGIMAERQCGSAVVMKAGCLVGIFTSADARRATAPAGADR